MKTDGNRKMAVKKLAIWSTVLLVSAMIFTGSAALLAASMGFVNGVTYPNAMVKLAALCIAFGWLINHSIEMVAAWVRRLRQNK